MRRHLAGAVQGRVLRHFEVLDPRFTAPAAPESVAEAVEGRRVRELGRRGKYLIWHLAGEVHLIMHLRMTGNLLVTDAAHDAPVRPHLRARLLLDDDQRVLFVDPRRFGTALALVGDDALRDYFAARLGVEPLSSDFTAEGLREIAAGRRSPVKAFLLSQERIAGVGNIYADEALFRARIHPLRPVGALKRGQLAALRDAVVASLEAGLDGRGASIDDFRHPDGARGTFQDSFLVHRREGEPCPRCGRTIVKMRAAGRGTYVCEGCQPRPRPRTGRTARAG